MLKVGQKLWWVPEFHYIGGPHEVTVVSIGRKWAQLDNYYKINVSTLRADGGQYMSPGRCYISREAYEREQELKTARTPQWILNWLRSF